jgi:endonuclease-3
MSGHIATTDESVRQKARRVYELLVGEYGEPEWHEHRDPVSELVLTILSQNTSDVNSGRAFQRLRDKIGSWESVLMAREEDIASAIKSAGLSRIKSKRIKEVLQSIVERNGSISLDSLSIMQVDEAKAWLRSLKGIGPKTAACVLLFSLGKPAMPVDTHVFRVSQRLGLVGARTNVEAAHEQLEHLVEPKHTFSFHINMIAHGRLVCKAQRPKCPACVLHQVCDNPVTLPRYAEPKG